MRKWISVTKLVSKQVQRNVYRNSSYLHGASATPLEYTSVSAALQASSVTHAAHPALVVPYEGVNLNYEQLLAKADALGCGLRALGLRKGDRFGIWAHNCSAWIIALVACLRVGVIPVAINPVYEKAELSFCLKKTGVAGLLIGEDLVNRRYYEPLCKLMPELPGSSPGNIQSTEFPNLAVIITADKLASPGTISSESLTNLKDSSRANISKYEAEITPEDGSIIHFTSGTTGTPKAAIDSNFGLVNNTFFIGKRNMMLNQYQRVCVQVPIFHALGSVVTVLGTLRLGSCLVLASPTYNVEANVKTIQTEKCSVIVGTPSMFMDLISSVRRQGISCRLQLALTAGAPCTPHLFQEMKKHLGLHQVKSLYGMTETTASVFQSLDDERMDLVTDTVGYIQDHVETKVVDEDGKLVPWGEPGELLVRGYSTMIGYWDEPEQTSNSFAPGGWLKTGDMFTLSDDGYGRIVGRKKDLIIRGGENIAPKEIEDILDSHPDILESQVVGVLNHRLGEEVCAVLRIRPKTKVTLDTVLTHLTGQLARFKLPTSVVILDEFPKTASGKVQKYKLKEIAQKMLNK